MEIYLFLSCNTRGINVLFFVSMQGLEFFLHCYSAFCYLLSVLLIGFLEEGARMEGHTVFYPELSGDLFSFWPTLNCPPIFRVFAFQGCFYLCIT
jgi:hypothetical protein